MIFAGAKPAFVKKTPGILISGAKESSRQNANKAAGPILRQPRLKSRCHQFKRNTHQTIISLEKKKISYGLRIMGRRLERLVVMDKIWLK
jgi:hypothetical protein